MSKVILTLALIALFSFASANRLETLNNLWGAWKVAHNKHYIAAHEETHRFNIFQNNINKIAELNAEHTDAEFAVNEFADLTSKEFELKYASGLGHAPITRRPSLPSLIVSDLPESIDWREKGAVTPVKNQGTCGSCWAFGAIGAVEGLHAINNGELLAFSEQQLVDCVTDPKDGHVYGCKGGWHHYAIGYAAENGVQVESDYPYTAKTGKCHYDSSKGHKVATGYIEVTPKKADELKAALAKTPVAVAIQANQAAFQFYKTGVLSKGCGAGINHAVLAVGYQQVNGKEAFIVKNSWGKVWGAQGYIYISTDASANNGSGVCGILAMPIAPK